MQKCKVLHVGRSNPKNIYNMNGTPLESVTKERDIGVTIQDNLKPSIQCAEAARKGGAVLGQISRAFLYRDRITFLKLYTQFVRCHLEFASPAWSPWTVGDTEILERIQRRAINLITGLSASTYEDKLKELNILSLENRRIRADLIQAFKILRGIDDVDVATWFNLVGHDVVDLYAAQHIMVILSKEIADLSSGEICSLTEWYATGTSSLWRLKKLDPLVVSKPYSTTIYYEIR